MKNYHNTSMDYQSLVRIKLERDLWIKLKSHYSTYETILSKKEYEDPTVVKSAHSAYYYKPFESCGHTVDVVLEAKAKERSLFKYIADFGV